VSSIVAAFDTPALAIKDIEAVADDLARPLREPVRPVGRREVDADRVGAAAALANLRDDPLGLFGAAAEMDENLGACLSEVERARASDASRGAGDESRFSRERGHDLGLR
jgi:hypothetical protein